jgi:hypothetical protein
VTSGERRVRQQAEELERVKVCVWGRCRLLVVGCCVGGAGG